ncbi:DUF3558 domain-containing protein [Amycolatopsis sp. NBC_01488]|uniref:DUF3558 domain-containing protein n=1 Tax=Amycolatopsis sp. NBC_01488 TaxID=2903563 RepID=UPI002E28DE14|nr:DUF3558 domain-containing protein [Amycolatopsis sp. NBC_01488]
MRRPFAVLCISLLALTGCTTSTNGTASPSPNPTGQPTSPSQESEAVPGPGVPKVETPLDISHFQQSPCDSLTTAQSQELLGSTVVAKPVVDDQAGPTCNWDVPAVSQAGVGVTYFKATKLGLTGIYRSKDSVYPFFMPLEPIDGYPTVAFGTVDERNSKGRCSLALGTSDTEQVDISVSLSETNIGKKDPCAAAHDVAAKVLENLRKVN